MAHGQENPALATVSLAASAGALETASHAARFAGFAGIVPEWKKGISGPLPE